MNGLIGNNNIYKNNKKINYLWVKVMEEIEYYWNSFSNEQKTKIKKWLYFDYNFEKKNIDRQIKNNIRKIYKYIEKNNKSKKKFSNLYHFCNILTFY